MLLTRSDAFRASWIFLHLPERPHEDRALVKDVLVAFFLIPYLLVVSAIYGYVVGNVVHVLVHVAFLGLLAHLVLQIALLLDPALPFSRPMQQTRVTGFFLGFTFVTILLSLFIQFYSARIYSNVASTVAAIAVILFIGIVIRPAHACTGPATGAVARIRRLAIESLAVRRNRTLRALRGSRDMTYPRAHLPNARKSLAHAPGTASCTSTGIVLASLRSAAVFGVEAYPGSHRGRCRLRAAPLHDGGAARCDRPREPRPCTLGDPELRLRVPAPSHHRQPRAGRCAQGGSSFDLPIALGLLATSGPLTAAPSTTRSSSASSRSTAASTAFAASSRSPSPPASWAQAAAASTTERAEASVVEGLDVCIARSLPEAVDALNTPDEARRAPSVPRDSSQTRHSREGDLADVRGQLLARRALEVAAAGGHNLLLKGPPGAGKTMMARRLGSILPPLTFDEALECTAIHSVAGTLPSGVGLLSERPFRAPHHTVSNVALVGGGAVPRPGEISLAHNGVLFLDEMPEFDRRALEVLRQPLEEGRVTIARAARTVAFPAGFVLVAAMNPCPCGFFGDEHRGCRCTPTQIAKYRGQALGSASRSHRSDRGGASASCCGDRRWRPRRVVCGRP
jgi:magnesium chelatase family protein